MCACSLGHDALSKISVVCVEIVEKYVALMGEFTKLSCRRKGRKGRKAELSGFFYRPIIFTPRKYEYSRGFDELLRPSSASQITAKHGAVLCRASIMRHGSLLGVGMKCWDKQG